MNETNWSSDFYPDIFPLGIDSLLNLKKKVIFFFEKFIMWSGFCILIISSKVVTNHVFALDLSLI